MNSIQFFLLYYLLSLFLCLFDSLTLKNMMNAKRMSLKIAQNPKQNMIKLILMICMKRMTSFATWKGAYLCYYVCIYN